ncbi:MAG: metal-dependent hydrolase [Sphingomonadaceae bacterium]|nr:metal-dependent hydrolase [Sphingomonadaceae bacterium]
MDNLAHSLAGAALGEAGLKKKTGLGMAALIIGANLPDIDVLGLLVNENLAWRRGWTHGPIAMLILPPLLAAALALFDHVQGKRGTRPADRLPIHRGWLLALAYVGWFSHPLLDYMNTYGIRLLMPFSERWFYGDVLFIIDLWIWIMLGLGVWLSRRRQRQGSAKAARPARLSLALSSAYILAMGLSSDAADRMTRDQANAQGLGPVTDVVASPVPLNPFRRDMVFVTSDSYGFGTLNWRPAPHIHLQDRLIKTNMDDPALAEARKDKAVADFLYWSRLPYAQVVRTPTTTTVTLADARYGGPAMRGPFVVTVKLPASAVAEQTQRGADRP